MKQDHPGHFPWIGASFCPTLGQWATGPETVTDTHEGRLAPRLPFSLSFSMALSLLRQSQTLARKKFSMQPLRPTAVRARGISSRVFRY